MDSLGKAVGGTAPSALDDLGVEDRAQLAQLVEAAVTRRSVALDAAIDDSLRYVPALLRGAVRRTLGL